MELKLLSTYPHLPKNEDGLTTRETEFPAKARAEKQGTEKELGLKLTQVHSKGQRMNLDDNGYSRETP